MEEEIIDITPEKSLMTKMGFVGFSPELAFAELIDNSIDAKYDEKTGKELVTGPIKIEISFNESKIILKDNSSGIENVKEALRLASSAKKNRLGTFGIGLKTATMTFGRKIIIRTKRINKDDAEQITLDPEEWDEGSSWKAKKSVFKEDKNKHYTIIEIQKLMIDPKAYDWENIRKDLAFRFSEFINSGIIKMVVDGVDVKTEEMSFISEEELKERLRQFGIPEKKFPSSRKKFKVVVKDMVIEGWVDILAKFSQTGRFGFNLYRGKRLVDPFSKTCGIANHPRHSRLFGHIYLPYEFPVTFTKDGLEVSRRVWMELSQEIKEVIKDHLSFCSKLAQHKSEPQVKPQTAKDVEDFLKRIEGAIKDSKLVNRLLTEEEKIKSKEENKKDDVKIEKREPKVRPSLNKPIPKGENERQPKDNKQTKKKFSINIPGLKINIDHTFSGIDEEPIKMYYDSYDKEGRTLTIVTNTAFDSWGLSKDESFYAAMNIISALAHFIFDQSENPSCSIEDIREDLWKNVGKAALREL